MNKRGFTLIELLGVILIISLLVIIVLPRITNSVNNFGTKTDKLMLNMIKDAAKLYIEDNSNKFVKQNGSNYCVTIEDLVNEDYLKGPIEYKGQNITKTKGFKVRYNNGFDYEFTDLYKGSCTLSDYIKNLYSETKTTTVNDIEYSLDETHSLMNDRLGSSDVAKTDGNIRYYGANPNNYIDIGDRDSNGNIIFWRIIGLFKNIDVTDENDNVIKTQDLVKIIRANNLTSGDVDEFSWDYTSIGEYDNNWHNSTLQIMLNNAYYNSEKTNYYNNSTVPILLNFASTGLSNKVHSKIEKANWNLGYCNVYNVYANVVYSCEADGINLWSGKVALMYPSDYGYSVDLKECQFTFSDYKEDACKNTNWLYDSTKIHWTLTPSMNVENVLNIISNGIVSKYYAAYYTYGVRPVLYLKSDVSIVEEKETSDGIKYFVVGE